jgi:hypothetical protein
VVSATTPGDQLARKCARKPNRVKTGCWIFFGDSNDRDLVVYHWVVLVHGEIAAHSAATRAATRDQGTSSVRPFSTTPRSKVISRPRAHSVPFPVGPCRGFNHSGWIVSAT